MYSMRQGLGSPFSIQTGVCGKVASPLALHWQPCHKSMVRVCRVCHLDLRLPHISTTWLNFHRCVTSWILADRTPVRVLKMSVCSFPSASHIKSRCLSSSHQKKKRKSSWNFGWGLLIQQIHFKRNRHFKTWTPPKPVTRLLRLLKGCRPCGLRQQCLLGVFYMQVFLISH